jgi:hypothetical protein
MDARDSRAEREFAAFADRAAKDLMGRVLSWGLPRGLSLIEMVSILDDPRLLREVMAKPREGESSQPSEPKEEAT